MAEPVTFWMTAGGGAVITLCGVLLGLVITSLLDLAKWKSEERQRQRDVIIPVIALKPKTLDAFSRLMSDYQAYDLTSPRSPELRDQMLQSRAEWFATRDELAHTISVAMLAPLDGQVRSALAALSEASLGSPIATHDKLEDALDRYNALGEKLNGLETAAQNALAK
ncbi:hypothetical protein [Gordonia iterans]